MNDWEVIPHTEWETVMTGTTWEQELPVPKLPEDPKWRENFCFDGYDKDRDVGFWIHCGRWSKDPAIWRPSTRYLPLLASARR